MMFDDIQNLIKELRETTDGQKDYAQSLFDQIENTPYLDPDKKIYRLDNLYREISILEDLESALEHYSDKLESLEYDIAGGDMEDV